MRKASILCCVCLAVACLSWLPSAHAEAPTLVWPKGARPITGASTPHDLRLFGDQIVFKTGSRASQEALWITDGTDLGTWMLPGARNGNGVGSVQILAQFQNDRLIWRNSAQLFSTDGTRRGTIELTSRLVDMDLFFQLPGATFQPAQELLFFQAHSAKTETLGLWVTDGTLDGTRLLQTLDGTGEKGLFYFKEINGKVAFFHGTKDQWTVWISDGTPEGTRPTLTVSDTSFPEDFDPDFAILNGQLVFTALRGPESVLLAVDVAQGELRELLPGKDHEYISFRFRESDGKILFQASKKNGYKKTLNFW